MSDLESGLGATKKNTPVLYLRNLRKETSWFRDHTHSWEKHVNGDLSSVPGGASGRATDSICNIREGFTEEVAVYLGLEG